MEMDIVSFKRVGNLTFGMKREKVREMLGPNFTVFRKSPWEVNTTDDYHTLGLHLYYTEHDELEFVEMFPPARPIFKGVDLMQKDVESTLKTLREFDPDPETDGASYIFHKIGIALYIETKLEAISAFSKEYYST